MSREQLPKPETIRWLQFTTRKQRFTIVSRIRHWSSHWDVGISASRRCGGQMCALCHAGMPKVLRYVCLVLDANGCQRLVEFRARHYGLLEVLRNQDKMELGTVLVGQKMGEAKNSPVDFKVVDQVPVIEQEIQRLVETFGAAPRFVQVSIEEENAMMEELIGPVADAKQWATNNPHQSEPT